MIKTNPFNRFISAMAIRSFLFVISSSILLIIAGGVLSAPTVADEITPAHTFQAADNINAELAAMHEANSSQPVIDEGFPALTPRYPRHVFQKAREVLIKVEMLRSLNGLSENPVPVFPVTEIKPANVLKMLDTALQDLTELRPIFKVTKKIAPAPLLPGKVPTDVYGNLQKASNSLDGLGIPKTVPNDVYRLALMIVDDLEKIRAARGKTDPVNATTGTTGKKPLDTYNRTFEILEALKAKVEIDPALKITGGIVLPNRRTGAITPSYVLDLENNVLAELSAIKAVTSISSPTVLPPPPQGKTPSDTYDLLTKALTMIGSL
ncbi:conserved hypothetical protein [Gammaproteobacteria bacterium]